MAGKAALKFALASLPLLCATTARADTLREALIAAYRTNPSLTGARAGLRAIDEGVPIAKASARPNLSATAEYQEFVVRSSNSFSAPLRATSANARLSLPLYQGGQVKNSIRAADARVEAGRANLRATEADVFTAIVSVYMDVLRDSAIVEFNVRNVAVLETNLQATRDRFEIGDLTRTDVAQSEARLSVARRQLDQATAQLDASLENYLRFVGLPARALEPPPALPGLPATSEEAVNIAVESNPQLLGAKADASAARYDVRVAAASRLPRLSAVASSGYNNYLGSLTSSLSGLTFRQAQTTATVGLSATIPLYQGGLPAAEVRRANALSGQALEGVRAENAVGTRNVLDVLNAEQELLNSRVQLVTAERDAYVAGFTLLAAMGRAEARDLNLFGGTLFEPGFSRPRSLDRPPALPVPRRKFL